MSSFPFTTMLNERKLIAKKERAVVVLTPWDEYYEINERLFRESVEPMLSEDYIRCGIKAPEDGIAYSGAESNPENPEDKLPNVTVLRNWGRFLCTTMGHHQGTPELEYQEVYEFHGFGVMVVDRDGKETVELYCMKPGDKVLIPSYCNMTLYSLDWYPPLITLDFANPELNKSSKDLQKAVTGKIGNRTAHVGPILCMYCEDGKFHIKLNRQYINRNCGSGVKVPGLDKESDATLTVKFPFDDTGPSIGSSAYKGIMHNRKRFGEMGIDVVEGTNSVQLGDMELSEPLWKIAEDTSKPLHVYFRML